MEYVVLCREFFVSTPLALLILCAVAILIDQSWNTALICVAICAGSVLAIISYSGWLLRKRRFTPQREKAYFRHYPKRKNYCNTLISIGAFLTNSLLVGFLIYHLLNGSPLPIINGTLCCVCRNRIHHLRAGCEDEFILFIYLFIYPVLPDIASVPAGLLGFP